MTCHRGACQFYHKLTKATGHYKFPDYIQFILPFDIGASDSEENRAHLQIQSRLSEADAQCQEHRKAFTRDAPRRASRSGHTTTLAMHNEALAGMPSG